MNIGDHDKLVTLLTPEHGRICVMAKGVSTLKSNLLPIVQLFTYGNYEIYQKGDSYWLRGGSPINPFYSLSDDIERLALASYIAEIAVELSDEGVDATDMLRLTLNAFYVIAKKDKPHAIVKGVYEFRAAAMAGYCPDIECCCVCGKPISENMYFDIMNGRLMCDSCFHKKPTEPMPTSYEYSDLSRNANIICPVTASVVAAMRYILTVPVQRMLSFSLKDREEEKIFAKACETYLLSHLERGFDSLTFYNSVRTD